MIDLKEKERVRLVEQQRLDSLKSAKERNVWGQFATPPALAEEIIQYAAGLTGRVRFLDPAIGSGSFYSALLRVVGGEQIEHAAGIELDHSFAEAARQLWADSGLQIVEADFTSLQAEPRFNLLVSNPPYVRHHHLATGEKERLQHEVFLKHRIRISGLAGLYCYFLLLADEWLEPDGLSIWLIPSEFMDVNYGHAVKQYLTDRVQLLQIHRFCPADVQFTDALVSSAIVAFRKCLPNEDLPVTMSFGGSLRAPNQASSVPLDTLRHSRKWTSFPGDGPRVALKNGDLRLGDLFTIKRGIATGSNSFFILTDEQAVREGIPPEFRRPILPNPRQVGFEIVESDERGYPANAVKLSLIDCALPEQELQARFPQFWRYLERGKTDQIHASYLASRRNPWYSQERRPPAPFLFTYMGRSGEGRKPFRVIWNKSAATAHNVYLLLYPKPVLKRALDEKPELYGVVFDYLRAIDTGLLLEQGRVYGGGLHKLEPKELARVPANGLWDSLRTGGTAPLAKPEQMALAWSRDD